MKFTRLRVTTMSQATRPDTDRTDLGPDHYMPATALPAVFDRVGAVARRLFGGHGLVPVPERYNE
jgi:hypothetical protein